MEWFQKKYKSFILCFVVVLFMMFLVKESVMSKQQSSISEEELLVVYTPHPTTFIQPIIEEFEKITGITVEVISKSSGDLLRNIEIRENFPQADIMWGGSIFTVSSYAQYFDVYITENEAAIQSAFLNKEGNMTRFSDVPSIIMVNTDLIGDIEIKGYQDLLKPELKGRIAYANPATSSSSFEQLINMLYACGKGQPEDGWEYVEQLCKNIDGNLLESSSAVYNGVANGEYIVGLTFEEAAANLKKAGKHVDIIYMEEGVISTPDGVYLVKEAQHKENAKEFMNFLTGYQVQYMISQNLERRSVRNDIPEVLDLPLKKEITMRYANNKEVLEKKEEWIMRFEEIYARENAHE
ncbi:MAG: extracellular solute-binding protein [Lachnospiraceae bacterium]|nr:extracellular solute-binding protein [Lachnospiraceae bacterium]